MDAQIAAVKALEKELRDLQKEVDKVANLLIKSRKQLEDDCASSEEGHEYVRERSYDCHSSYNTYTCDRCGHFTMIRPKRLKTDK